MAAAAGEPAMPCCPKGSWPALEASHVGKGTFIDIGDGLQAYQVGAGPRGVLFVTDIFGPREGGGRNQLIADQLAELGFNVLVPDYFKGDYAEWPAGADRPTGPKGSDLMEWLKKYTWSGSVAAQTQQAVAYMRSKGVGSIGALGFCWGVGPCLEVALSGDVVCMASAHPSMALLGLCAGHTEEEFKAIKVPVLMLPAAQDADSIKPEGDFIKALGANGVECISVEFPKSNHGFFPRAPLDNEQALRDVTECWDHIAKFFSKHLGVEATL